MKAKKSKNAAKAKIEELSKQYQTNAELKKSLLG